MVEVGRGTGSTKPSPHRKVRRGWGHLWLGCRRFFGHLSDRSFLVATLQRLLHYEGLQAKTCQPGIIWVGFRHYEQWEEWYFTANQKEDYYRLGLKARGAPSQEWVSNYIPGEVSLTSSVLNSLSTLGVTGTLVT